MTLPTTARCDDDDLQLLRRAVTIVVALQTSDGAVVYLQTPPPVPSSTRAPSPGNHPWDTWVPVRFEVASADHARRFVAAVAKWCNVTVPQVRPSQVKVTYNWYVKKLALQRGNHAAEVYLDLIDGGDEELSLGRIVVPEHIGMREKDESYRTDLVRLLLEALLSATV